MADASADVETTSSENPTPHSEPAADAAPEAEPDTEVQRKLARGRACRAEAAAHWKAGDVGKALFSWHELLLTLSGLDRAAALAGAGVPGGDGGAPTSLSPLEHAEQVDLQLLAHSNLALGLLKRGKFERAVECATAALALDPGHAKSLYRRGKAYEGLRDADRAEADFRKALEVEPGNGDVKAALRGLKPLQEEQRRASSALFSKMLGGGGAA